MIGLYSLFYVIFFCLWFYVSKRHSVLCMLNTQIVLQIIYELVISAVKSKKVI